MNPGVSYVIYKKKKKLKLRMTKLKASNKQ